MIGYIYLTTNLINNKKYIGQRRGFKVSPENDSYLGSGKLLQRAIKRYGKENFHKEILEYCDSLQALNVAEKKWIEKYNAVENKDFYNIAKGGDAGDTWTGRTDEEKDKFREIIAESNRHRNRNPKNMQGNKNPAFNKKWCNDGNKNYLLPIEEIESRNLVLGMIRTKEHNDKISLANRGKKHNYSSTEGRICYNNGLHNKFLKKNDIEQYQKLGWVKGMINTRWEVKDELS